MTRTGLARNVLTASGHIEAWAKLISEQTLVKMKRLRPLCDSCLLNGKTRYQSISFLSHVSVNYNVVSNIYLYVNTEVEFSTGFGTFVHL